MPTHMKHRDAGVKGGGQFLTDRLTLFEPGGQIMSNTLPTDFGQCSVSVKIATQSTLRSTRQFPAYIERSYIQPSQGFY